MDFKQLHSTNLVIDAHCDTVLRMIREGYLMEEKHSTGHVDLPRLALGGVNVQFFAAYIEPAFKMGGGVRRALQLFDTLLASIEKNKNAFHLILSAHDIEVARRENKVGALLSIEGGEALEGELAVLRMFHRLGVRAIGLTWNERNRIADGVGEKHGGSGLTDFGVKVIQEMNRLGMIVDVSHISEKGFWNCLEVSAHPIIASHSNARRLCDHERNLTDEQIKGLANNGGVMGINFSTEFLATEGKVTIDTVVDHMEHIAGLVGIEHVGIGADYDGIKEAPEGLEDVSKLPLLTEGMLRRGFSPEEIGKVLGGNFMRVISQVLR